LSFQTGIVSTRNRRIGPRLTHFSWRSMQRRSARSPASDASP
jgi:hypothetical protein